MLFSKASPLNILTCPVCHSTGYVKFYRCRNCHGLSMGRMARGKFLYWGESISKYAIGVRRGRRWLNGLRLAGALIFSFGLWGMFVWQIYLEKKIDSIFTIDFWFKPNFYLVIFWLGVISFFYFFYRLLVSEEKWDAVEIRDYKETKELKIIEETTVTDWKVVVHLPKKKKKDITDCFTNEARQVLEQAYFLANKNKNAEMTAEHIFYALLSFSKVSVVFWRLGISVKIMQAKLAQLFNQENKKSVPQLAEDVCQILFQAYEIAYEKRQEFVNVTELLLASVKQSERLQEILYDLNIDKDKLTNAVEWLRIRERLRRQHQKFRKAASRRSKYGLDRAMTAVATPYLNSFSEDLTMAAKFGYLSPCVARDEEIVEIFRIIEGGRQSVVLVGDHGVGKMSIIEGLAQKMIEEDVPSRLKDKRLVQLSTSALLAGATVSGAQERLIRIMNEVARAKNIILFIKNIHDLVGVSENSGQGVDMAETLAEYLGPGKFFTFATATTLDYNQQIINSNLGKVLARVDIKEMVENQAIQVLEAKVGVIEYKHNVFFSYDAIVQCVKLAKKFLHEQNLPESALEIMTEAAGFARHNKGENQIVTNEDVAAIISHKTGVPVTSLTEDETAKLMRLEEVMHGRVIGQDEGVNLVANALRRARVEMRSQKKPIASFLFLGPTGVGKTELAKTIAEVYFGGENNMIRLDMSEYQDKSAIYRLIGQPGQQGSGVLTEAVRQKPFSLVLLDELEKADPDILTLFLQVLDDGRLTDSTGRVIDFTSVIIIATSNAGTSFVQEQIIHGMPLENIRQQLIRSELKKYYKPEFLNRFDGIVLFRPLNKFEIRKVASLMLKRVAEDLEKRGVALRVEEAGLTALADAGFDPEFGARPMRRAIQDLIENKLAELILQGGLQRRDTVVLGENAEIRVERNG